MSITAREQRAQGEVGPSRIVYVNGHTQCSSGLLAMGALCRGEEPRAPTGDPRVGEMGLLSANPFHRTSRYNMYAIQRKKKSVEK